ncbi:MAG: erythromycin esterase family protein, partial [Candidatus Eisenbacteria bacterium]|nr:erythromycin esterase family protein [Candidatus Eisenbacteria bacterium]
MPRFQVLILFALPILCSAPRSALQAAGLPESAGSEALDFGFEEGDPPDGWFLGGEGYDAGVDHEIKHSGRRSVRLAFREGTGFGVATASFPADSARGRSLHLSGYLKTEGIGRGWAGLWMRVDGPDGPLQFDNMQRRGVTGTTDWIRYDVELPVAEEATNINFGALLAGDGTVWIDDLALEVGKAPPAPTMITIDGVVLDGTRTPIPGALVALIAPESRHADAWTLSDAEGRFEMEVVSHEYGVTATAEGLTAAYLGPRAFEQGSDNTIEVVMSGDGILVEGTMRDELDRAVPNTLVELPRVSMDVADLFYAQTDDEGRFRVRLPRAQGYLISSGDLSLRSDLSQVPGDRDSDIDFMVVRDAPADDAVVMSLRGRAIPLTNVQAEHGFADMQPIREIVGSARVVGLGEATHGTREFFQLKHRFLEFLVEEMGFRVFAIEANWPECFAINDYVLHGEGDPVAALDGIYFWTWNTKEVLSQIEWMRRYNANPAHVEKLQFLGFDMQTTHLAANDVATYLSLVDRDAATEFEDVLIAYTGGASAFATSPPESLRATRESLDTLLRRFDERRSAYEDKTSEEECRVARQEVVLLQQATQMYAEGSMSMNARDEAMAANVQWILQTQAPGTRIVLWAHNGHIQRTPNSSWKTMGTHLAEALDSDYVCFGFAFDHGGFQAQDWTGGQGNPGGLRAFEVGPAPPENIE